MEKREWLIQLRKEKKLSFKAISELAGVTTTCWQYYEVGKRTPRTQKAKKIGNLLGFNWTKFYE